MTIPDFQKILLERRGELDRDMPWRNTEDPYRILVSEVMLQQTQIARVLPKYGEFLGTFPTIESLAAAPDGQLLLVWQGLGYWRRAKYLKQAAQTILEKHGGVFPKNPADLARLPGIGHYTARALACFAFNSREAFIDTNIRRVYLHFFFPTATNISDKKILELAQEAIDALPPHIAPREWGYALFDYGAVILKDKSVNKRSRHYAKQKKFEGSFRFYRAETMRFLLSQPEQKATAASISRMLKQENAPYAPHDILQSLIKDGLAQKRGSNYFL